MSKSPSLIFYSTSKPIVGLGGEIRSRVSADELLAYGIPEIASAVAEAKSFTIFGATFTPEAQAIDKPTVPVEILPQSQRSDHLWYMTATAIIALAFTALGWWGKGQQVAAGGGIPCPPAIVQPAIAQPVCDESTGACR